MQLLVGATFAARGQWNERATHNEVITRNFQWTAQNDNELDKGCLGVIRA